MNYKRKLNFGKITLQDLQSFVKISEVDDAKAFEKWFSFDYELNSQEKLFIQELQETNKPRIDYYLEEELKAKMIIPMTNQIKFHKSNKANDWYERSLEAVINEVLLTGNPDFMVAGGVEAPEKPYFFIQEYKQTLGSIHPKNPLLAEMMVAMEHNKETEMKGAFIIGRSWCFVILKKIALHEYIYHISYDFSVFKMHELEGIYKNLQYIKDWIIKS